MNLHLYTLDNGKIKACSDFLEAPHWREKNDTQVALSEINSLEKISVSTVFLVIDLSFGREKYPVLFETAVFMGDEVSIRGRSCTLQEAKSGHANVCKEINKMIAKTHLPDMEP
jgi:hypothetical protein